MTSSSAIVGHNLNIGSYQWQSRPKLYCDPISKLAFSSSCGNQIPLWSNKSRLAFKRKSLVVNANIIPEAPLPPSTPPPSSSGFMSWLLGIVLSIILPFCSHNWGPLWVFKSRIDNTVQIIENVAEMVVKVAGKVDEIAGHIADDLPEGPLKNIFRVVERAAKKTAVVAGAVDEAIDEVQDAEKQAECIVTSMVQNNAKKIPKPQIS